MQKRTFTQITFALLCFFNTFCFAQTGIITTIAGGGTGGVGIPATSALLDELSSTAFDQKGNLYIVSATNSLIYKVDTAGIISIFAGIAAGEGYSGDGGPATAAALGMPTGVAFDHSGNMIIADNFNNVIRKIDTAGIITTIGGNHAEGYCCDLGPATAARINLPNSIAIDPAGNIYFPENDGQCIRKISASGIISTFAGAHYSGYGGDGGLATSAVFSYPTCVAIDPAGNKYVVDQGNNRIRKINTSGIISTVAGNGIAGFSGDGWLASLSEINTPTWIVSDVFGNIYFTDDGNDRIRKISTTGIISTVAGNGVSGFSGDGGLATDANLNSTIGGGYGLFGLGIDVDAFCNLYITDDGNKRVRKVSAIPDISADSFRVFVDKSCDGPQLSIIANHSSGSLSIKTYFGDGTAQTNAVTMATAAGYTSFNHAYTFPGTYSIKLVLFDGASPVDSATYSYNYMLCNNIALKFYYDALANCTFDSTYDSYNYNPITVEVDSNGIAVDTISATSGVYYAATGVAGDVYGFKIISAPGGFLMSCPSSGIIYDTLQPSEHSANISNYFGFTCATSPGFDLQQFTATTTGRHMQKGALVVNNSYCNPVDAMLTLQFSPKYNFQSAYPTPVSVIDNVITWNLGYLAAGTSAATTVGFTLSVPTPDIVSTWLTPGDTVHSMTIVDPTTGDVDTGNNRVIIVDTVKSSYDPNEMSVIPEGYILPGMTLQYTINFENTGNDTAHNIYVLDTLPPYVNPNSLRLLAASSAMNISMATIGGLHIVKFDFPGINLLDSSHHNQCDGLVVFEISTIPGLSDGTTVFNHAGIFFDDNPVVMTDTSENIIGLINGAGSICAGSDTALNEATAGGIWSASNSNAIISSTGIVSGVTAGTDIISYTVNSQFGTTTTTKAITIDPGLPVAGTITGPSSVCVAATITLTDTVIGGAWHCSNSYATISSGTAIGVTTGIDTISYALTNSCGTTSSLKVISIDPLPLLPAAITGLSTVCAGGATTLLTDSVAGGLWNTSNGTASISGGLITGLSAGIDTITYFFSNSCGTNATSKIVNIAPLPDAGIITGPGVVCVSDAITLTDTATAGTWTATNSSANVMGGAVSGVTAGIDTINYMVVNSCGSISATAIVTVNPMPFVPAAISGLSTVCAGGATITLNDSVSGGTWTSSNILASVSVGVVTGNFSGMDTISYSFSNSCGTAAVSKIITINPLPDAGSISGATDVCTGSDITLSDSVSGGMWIMSNTSATVSSGIVSGISAGTDTVGYVVSNSCGTATATKYLSVDPLPADIIGTAHICQYASATLNDTSFGGVWSSGNTSIASVEAPTGVVTGVSPGITTIIYTLPTGCSKTFSIKVYPAPASITGSSTICFGATDTLTDAMTGGIWSSGATSITTIGAVTGIISGVSTGVSAITYTSFYGCTTSVNITVIPGPNEGTIAGADTVCSGQSVILSETITGGTWSTSNSSFATVNATGTVSGISEGTDTIIYTVTNDCGTASADFSLSIMPSSICGTESVAINKTSATSLTVFPNPNDGSFRLQLSSPFDEQLFIVITNVIGEKIQSFAISSNTSYSIALNQPPGIYILSAVTSHGNYVIKITIN